MRVFRDAVRLAFVTDCAALDQVDYDAQMERTLDELRRDLGIEVDLLAAYYAIERRRYPAARESQRLLD